MCGGFSRTIRPWIPVYRLIGRDHPDAHGSLVHLLVGAESSDRRSHSFDSVIHSAFDFSQAKLQVVFTRVQLASTQSYWVVRTMEFH